VALRALGRRVAKLEVARQPRPTPFDVWFGSVDDWFDKHVIPSIARGEVCAGEMLNVVAAVRSWHEGGHYASWAHERIWER
jgi:hypothetical protein